MKNYALFSLLALLCFSVQGQTITELKENNNQEIKKLKKEYYQALQEKHDARILSINEQRSGYIYKKFEDKRELADELYRKDSIYRTRLKSNKQFQIKKARSNKEDELRNEIGFRRVSRAIDSIENKRKLDILRAQNKREAFYRSQQLKLEMLEKEQTLEQKINKRHQTLKDKYALPEH